MAPAGGVAALALLGTLLRASARSICRPGDPSEGGCSADGTGCPGEAVELLPYQMHVGKWDNVSKTSKKTGHITSYYINGKQDTWQMYLHGPHIHERERVNPEDTSMPPVYVYATFTNQVYRFENFSRPEAEGAPLRATQKMVGHALAPSTGYIIEDESDNRVKGLLIAEGQPFWTDNISDPMASKEVYKGGVEYLQSGVQSGAGEVCPQIFPTDPFHKKFGQVVNTIDCHRPLGVCFFTVWKFYDDQYPLWNKETENIANDCLYYCIMEKDWTTNQPNCEKTAIVVDEHGDPICHKDGVGAVHGMTVGNTDPEDPTKFDIFLVFTGKAKMDDGESSMKKVKVQVVPSAGTHDLKVLESKPYALDLFTKYAPKGLDVGGDHAWVDATGKWIWVSCFRSAGVGAHMLDYETGNLIYSVTGLDTLVPNQYTYTAGIHGIGTLGKKGSYLVIATSSCHNLKICIPTVPWEYPIPKSWWSTAPFVILDLNSMTEALPESKAAPPTMLV